MLPPPVWVHGSVPVGGRTGQRAQRGQAGNEQIFTGPKGDDPLRGGDQSGRVAVDRELAGPPGPADQRIAVIAEAKDVAVVAPLLLQELELAIDAGVEAQDGAELGVALANAMRRSIPIPPLRGLPDATIRWLIGDEVAAMVGINRADWT